MVTMFTMAINVIPSVVPNWTSEHVILEMLYSLKDHVIIMIMLTNQL